MRGPLKSRTREQTIEVRLDSAIHQKKIVLKELMIFYPPHQYYLSLYFLQIVIVVPYF